MPKNAAELALCCSIQPQWQNCHSFELEGQFGSLWLALKDLAFTIFCCLFFRKGKVLTSLRGTEISCMRLFTFQEYMLIRIPF